MAMVRGRGHGGGETPPFHGYAVTSFGGGAGGGDGVVSFWGKVLRIGRKSVTL